MKGYDMMAFKAIMSGALGDHALPCAHGEINVFLNAERRYFFSVKHNETVKQRMETLV